MGGPPPPPSRERLELLLSVAARDRSGARVLLRSAYVSARAALLTFHWGLCTRGSWRERRFAWEEYGIPFLIRDWCTISILKLLGGLRIYILVAMIDWGEDLGAVSGDERHGRWRDTGIRGEQGIGPWQF
ncbi:uncharacterized protein LOC143185124 [Calliopsis andreniformis]|uniref:uncharacterized protein LOC143185124 n=1 Tax=Calliopsis andreniformis TaxID=337506 RepID=UPI003FCE1DA1